MQIGLFQSDPQSSTWFSIFDPNNDVSCLTNAQLYRLQNMPTSRFQSCDQQPRSNSIDLLRKNASIAFPGHPSLCLGLKHPYLNIQLYFVSQVNWCITVQISDQQQVVRTIRLSADFLRLQKNLSEIKYPCKNVPTNCWVTLAIDLGSFSQAFKGSQYSRLQNITISGMLKIGKIFTTQKSIDLNRQSICQQNICPAYLFDLHSSLCMSIKYEAMQINTNLRAKIVDGVHQLIGKKKGQELKSAILPKLKQRVQSRENGQTQKKKDKEKDKIVKLPDCKNGNKENDKRRNSHIFISHSQRVILRKQPLHCSNKLVENAPSIKRIALQTINCSTGPTSNNQQIGSQRSRHAKYSTLASCELQYDIREHYAARHEEIEEDIEEESQVSVLHKTEIKNEVDETTNTPSIEAPNPSPPTPKPQSFHGFGEKVIQKCLQQGSRPYSPPLLDDSTQESKLHKTGVGKLSLIYDPILGCYYDCKAQCFYKLKN